MLIINDKRQIQRKLRILRYAEEIDHVAKSCRYFGIGRASFYRGRKACAERGEAGLINAPHSQMARQYNIARAQREGSAPSSQIPSGANANRLVS